MEYPQYYAFPPHIILLHGLGKASTVEMKALSNTYGRYRNLESGGAGSQDELPPPVIRHIKVREEKRRKIFPFINEKYRLKKSYRFDNLQH